jgi:hypothetical protein
MVVLVTSDSERFTAEREVVERSVLIKNMLEGLLNVVPFGPPIDCVYPDVGESDQPIPLPNVSSSVMKKVIGRYIMFDSF